jgi:virginiamycin A acetyltransferase
MRWWDWPIEKITENLEALTGGDIERLKEVGGST